MRPDLFALILLAVLLVPWAAWRLGRRLHSRKRRRRARLYAAARREPNPARRRKLLLEWNDLGGADAAKRTYRKSAVRTLGQQARTRGEPASANPYRNRLWGPGRQWKAGWHSVDRQIRWIEQKRRAAR